MCAKYTNSQPNNAAYNIQQYAVKIDSKRYNLKIKIQDVQYNNIENLWLLNSNKMNYKIIQRLLKRKDDAEMPT